MNQENPSEFEAELPYAGTSGYSGSETSKDRALRADKSGKTKALQFETLRLLNRAGANGLTYKELDEYTQLGHGTVSGTLSVLHKTGHIARLVTTRNNCKVYVLPDFVIGRTIEKQKQKCCPHCGGNL